MHGFDQRSFDYVQDRKSAACRCRKSSHSSNLLADSNLILSVKSEGSVQVFKWLRKHDSGTCSLLPRGHGFCAGRCVRPACAGRKRRCFQTHVWHSADVQEEVTFLATFSEWTESARVRVLPGWHCLQACGNNYQRSDKLQNMVGGESFRSEGADTARKLTLEA